MVTGEVRLRIHPRGFAVEGVCSPHTLMRVDASYGEGTSLWTGAEAAAFAKVFGVPQMLAMNAGKNNT
jgi:argininosuccinate synthase